MLHLLYGSAHRLDGQFNAHRVDAPALFYSSDEPSPKGQAQADALVRALGDEKNLVLIENTVRRCAHAVADGWMEAVPMPVLIGGVTVMGFTMCSQNYYYWSLGMAN